MSECGFSVIALRLHGRLSLRSDCLADFVDLSVSAVFLDLRVALPRKCWRAHVCRARQLRSGVFYFDFAQARVGALPLMWFSACSLQFVVLLFSMRSGHEMMHGLRGCFFFSTLVELGLEQYIVLCGWLAKLQS